MALLSAGCGGTAQKSPSGNIRAEVFAGKEGLYYTVTHDGRTVIDTSALGITIDDTELFRDAALRRQAHGKSTRPTPSRDAKPYRRGGATNTSST